MFFLKSVRNMPSLNHYGSWQKADSPQSTNLSADDNEEPWIIS